jgi:hypothetical protein
MRQRIYQGGTIAGMGIMATGTLYLFNSDSQVLGFVFFITSIMT